MEGCQPPLPHYLDVTSLPPNQSPQTFLPFRASALSSTSSQHHVHYGRMHIQMPRGYASSRILLIIIAIVAILSRPRVPTTDEQFRVAVDPEAAEERTGDSAEPVRLEITFPETYPDEVPDMVVKYSHIVSRAAATLQMSWMIALYIFAGCLLTLSISLLYAASQACQGAHTTSGRRGRKSQGAGGQI